VEFLRVINWLTINFRDNVVNFAVLAGSLNTNELHEAVQSKMLQSKYCWTTYFECRNKSVESYLWRIQFVETE